MHTLIHRLLFSSLFLGLIPQQAVLAATSLDIRETPGEDLTKKMLEMQSSQTRSADETAGSADEKIRKEFENWKGRFRESAVKVANLPSGEQFVPVANTLICFPGWSLNTALYDHISHLPIPPSTLNISEKELHYKVMADLFSWPAPKKVTSEDWSISTRDIYDLKLRQYYVKGSDTQTPGKLIFFIHGGGWVGGSLDTHDNYCRHLCKNTQTHVIAVAYRLAPAHPFPTPLQDVEDAYLWIRGKYPAPSTSLYVAGDSAGANLACALAHKLLKARNLSIIKLVLFYPCLDLRIPDFTRSPYANGPVLTRSLMNTFIRSYLNQQDPENPLCSPIFSHRLQDFPPTLIISGECDLLTDEAIKFATLLQEKQVQVKHIIYKGACHSFGRLFRLFPEAREAMKIVSYFCLDEGD